MSHTPHSYCGPCGQPDDNCHCVLCATCGHVAALEHAEPAHYDEARDEVLCSRCSDERKAMRDAHELKLTREQARLEQQGWRFDVAWSALDCVWSVYVWNRRSDATEAFIRSDRSDALSHALQFAALQTEQSHAAE